MSLAVYPGSFDPFTKGHLDILQRCSKLFDHLIVGVLEHPTKKCLFEPQERVEMISDVTADLENVRVAHFNGLLVNFCREVGARTLIRGLRAVSDYEYELQIFSVNKQLAPEVETMFMMSSTQYSFLSSSIVKEVARYGGDLSQLVPKTVEKALRKKFQKN